MNENQKVVLEELKKRFKRQLGWPLSVIYGFQDDFEKNFNPMESYERGNTFKAYYSMSPEEEIEVLKSFTEFVVNSHRERG